MAAVDKDEVPMLSDTHPNSSYECLESQTQRFAPWARSASISIPMNSTEPYEGASNLVGHTGPLRSERRTPFIQMSGPLYPKPESLYPPLQGALGRKTAEAKMERYPSSLNKLEQNELPNNYAGKNEHLLRSGQLGMCNDPYCTTCPTFYNYRAEQKYPKASNIFDSKFHNALYGDAKGWARRLFSLVCSYVPGVMHPHAKVVQQWNKFFVISCLVAIFVDPLFFFLLSVQQFRLAYFAPDSRGVGAGELVDHPRRIALNYLRRYFLLDIFVVLPLPQIMILLVLPKILGASGANYAKNLLRAAVLVQYIPRLYRILPLLAGQSPNGFIFESAWANFFINLLTFVLSSHVVGSSWYLFGLQSSTQIQCGETGQKM